MSIRQVLSRTLATSLSTVHFPLTLAFSSTSQFSPLLTHRISLTPLFSMSAFPSFCTFFTLEQISPVFPITSQKTLGYTYTPPRNHGVSQSPESQNGTHASHNSNR